MNNFRQYKTRKVLYAALASHAHLQFLARSQESLLIGAHYIYKNNSSGRTVKDHVKKREKITFTNKKNLRTHTPNAVFWTARSRFTDYRYTKRIRPTYPPSRVGVRSA
ncbi:hypothetical protein TNCT_179391 [Trichonephila clavata]|uniref:Uncharacterized protein n=1 Tax=Trichonephila clavata TaxID=2740835 RepID=A0A8X6HK22_TRICU|nr:hypothetical protein TNCT_179391 [Trichonephila clavata]